MSRPHKPIGRRAPSGMRAYWFAVGFAALVCAVGLFHTWTRAAVFQRSYAIGRAVAENERLSRELAKVKLEVAALEAQPRVDAEAQKSLAMKKAPADRIVVVPAKTAALAVPARDAALAVNDGR